MIMAFWWTTPDLNLLVIRISGYSENFFGVVLLLVVYPYHVVVNKHRPGLVFVVVGVGIAYFYKEIKHIA